jgi:outer membrane protein OmpA-like peptidoglycan-associated protein
MNLIHPLLNSFPPQTWTALAGSLNETPEHTRQGLADALPMFFASLIGKGSTPAGAAGLLAMIRNNHVNLDRVASGRESAVTEPGVLREGGTMAQSVLGDGFGNAANAISRHAGIALSSAQSLLGLAAPLALGGVAKAAPPSGFTPEGLMRFLQGQRDDVLSAAPQGLPINVARAAETVRTTAAPAPRTGNRWLPWLAGLAALIVLGLVLNQCATQRAVTTPVPEAPPKIVAPPAPPASNIIDLPGGIRLNVAPGSIGYNLATFLGSGQPAPRTFTFDNMNFDSGNVVLTPESIATLDAIASTLNAYPTAQVRLEGHTDSTGDHAANVALSLARAQAVAKSLMDRGVEQSRITAAGFGPDRPIAGNDTEAGRAQNRRLELTVTQK